MGSISTKLSRAFSSRSSGGCKGSSCIQLNGVRVLASSSQSERHHQEIHRFLLQPTPHGKAHQQSIIQKDNVTLLHIVATLFVRFLIQVPVLELETVANKGCRGYCFTAFWIWIVQNERITDNQETGASARSKDDLCLFNNYSKSKVKTKVYKKTEIISNCVGFFSFKELYTCSA